jgi:hypothetical protein
MTPHANERRRMATLALALGAVLAIISAAVTAFDLDRLKPPTAAGPVLPGFSKAVGAAQAITIATKDAAYHIVRTDRGWVLRDRGDYPVQRDRLAQFTQGLATLSYVRPMTRDPNKLDRLGLGDPAQGGDGILVQVQNAQGALLANLLLGMSPSGAYMRAPDKDQAWAVKGDLPPLKDPAQWLDLAPLSIDVSRIIRATVIPPVGPAYALNRGENGDFVLDKPFDRLLVVSPEGVNTTAQAFATLKPIDVAGAPAITGAAGARATMRTANGLLIEGELIGQGGRHWLKLVARGETPEAQAEAQAINARAAAWAYGLSDLDYADFAPPLSALARAPNVLAPPEPPQPPAGAGP